MVQGFKNFCLFFLMILGGCTAYFVNDFSEKIAEADKPKDISDPNLRLSVPEVFEVVDAYDSRLSLNLSGDGETNGIFKAKDSEINIKKIIQLPGLRWQKGPIDKKIKGWDLYRWAFANWDSTFLDIGRPKLPSDILFLSRKELFESKSFLHLGTCQNAKEEEFLPCSDGLLMIYDPQRQLLYVSQFNS